MYQIYYNSALIFDPRGMNNAEPGDYSLTATAGSLHLAVGSAGSLAFTLPAGNPAIGTIRAMTGTVKVVETASGDTAFLGRVTTDTLIWDSSHTYDCEGLLACLNDKVMPPYKFPDNYTGDTAYQQAAASGNVVAYWLGKLLETYNAMCWDTSHRIQLGNVTVRAAGNAFARSSEDWNSIWDVITGDLPSSELGGVLVPRYVGDVIYLDYLAAITETNAQAVSFGENLMDFARSQDYMGIFNGVVPVGKDGLTCAGAPNGYYGSSNQYYKQAFYLLTPASRDVYDNILRVVSWPDVESATELVSRAVSYLDSNVMVDSMTITAADLNGIDPTTARFQLAKLLQILSPPHNIREKYAIVELDIDLLDQVSTKITLGERGAMISGSSGGGRSAATGGGGVVIGTVTGVKGNAESVYRDGNVNLTPANIGAVNLAGDTMTGALNVGAGGTYPAVTLQQTAEGRGNIGIYQPSSGTRQINMYTSSGGGEIDIENADGAHRVALYVSTAGNGVVRLYDANGNDSTVTKAKIDTWQTAIVGITRSGNTYTATRADGSTFTFTQNSITVDAALSSTSTNPVQNKAIATRITDISETLELLDQAITGKISRSGDTMTGPLNVGAGGTYPAVTIQQTAEGRGNIGIYQPSSGTRQINMYTSSGGGEIDIENASGSHRAALYVNTNDVGVLRLYDANGNGSSVTKAKIDTWDNKVDRSGDTMTGTLTITNTHPVVLKNTTIDVSAAPSAVVYGQGVMLYDKNNVMLGYFRPVHWTSGSHGLQIETRRVVNGSVVYNTLSLNINADGTRTVTLSHPAAWRSALGVISAAGGTMTGALNVGAGGTYPAVTLQQTAEGRGNIGIYQPSTGTRQINMYTSSGGGEIDIENASGARRVALYVSTNDIGILRLYDASGNNSTVTKAKIDTWDKNVLSTSIVSVGNLTISSNGYVQIAASYFNNLHPIMVQVAAYTSMSVKGALGVAFNNTSDCYLTGPANCTVSGLKIRVLSTAS